MSLLTIREGEKCNRLLAAVTIPAGVTSIGEGAFAYCSSLTAISVSAQNRQYQDIDGVLFTKDGKTLHSYPVGKPQTAYTIPEGVTRIGEGAFANCASLAAVAIPEGVTSIGEWAFSNCYRLTAIMIPDSVTVISEEAFAYCSSLTAISVSARNWQYQDIDGVLFTKDGKTLHTYPMGNTRTAYAIPASVTRIGQGAFFCSSLAAVTIPASVTIIGQGAFWGCFDLTAVAIPASVTIIGEWAFRNCTSLAAVTIPEGVTIIGEGAFSGCRSLVSVTIPASVTRIDGGAFRGCDSLRPEVRANIERRFGGVF